MSLVALLSKAEAKSLEVWREIPLSNNPSLKLVVQMAKLPIRSRPLVLYPASLCMAKASSMGTLSPSCAGA